MSTILYGDEKFLKIYENLSIARNGQQYAHVFGYPEGWNQPGGMDQYYKGFVDNLRVANIRAYNTRYEDGDELEISLLDFSRGVMPYSSDIHLYQALQSIRYNIDREDVNNCAEILDNLIDDVAYSIISKLPEYEEANVW